MQPQDLAAEGRDTVTGAGATTAESHPAHYYGENGGSISHASISGCDSATQ
jgi:hypothetical protein